MLGRLLVQSAWIIITGEIPFGHLAACHPLQTLSLMWCRSNGGNKYRKFNKPRTISQHLTQANDGHSGAQCLMPRCLSSMWDIYIYNLYIYGICYIFLHQNLQRALCINPDFQMDRLEGPIIPSQEPRCPRPAPCCRSLACRDDELPARPNPRHIVRFIQFFSQRSQFGVYFDTASAHENCSKVIKPWVYYGILMYIIYHIVQLGESIATFF